MLILCRSHLPNYALSQKREDSRSCMESEMMGSHVSSIHIFHFHETAILKRAVEVLAVYVAITDRTLSILATFHFEIYMPAWAYCKSLDPNTNYG